MDLKDFVKTTLVDIVKGIDDANKELSAMNSFVATDNLDKIGNEQLKVHEMIKAKSILYQT